MNNDEQIKLIMSRFETIERNQKALLDLFYARLKVASVVQVTSIGRYKMDIIGLVEEQDGVHIQVK